MARLCGVLMFGGWSRVLGLVHLELPPVLVCSGGQQVADRIHLVRRLVFWV